VGWKRIIIVLNAGILKTHLSVGFFISSHLEVSISYKSIAAFSLNNKSLLLNLSSLLGKCNAVMSVAIDMGCKFSYHNEP
jgi:hypothetical protein